MSDRGWYVHLFNDSGHYRTMGPYDRETAVSTAAQYKKGYASSGGNVRTVVSKSPKP